MKSVKLARNESSDEGTFGIVTVDFRHSFVSGELPWRDNKPGLSCIPLRSLYLCRYRLSPAHGMCYHVEEVPGRTDIEIHAANLMGDIKLGFETELKGCIALGLGFEVYHAQKALRSSAAALKEFEELLAYEDFELTVV